MTQARTEVDICLTEAGQCDAGKQGLRLIFVRQKQGGVTQARTEVDICPAEAGQCDTGKD